MALWVVRAGRRAEYEARFFADSRIYLTWEELPDDLSPLQHRDDVRELLERVYPPGCSSWIPNHTNEISAFLFKMELGDYVLLPRKGRHTVAIGQITGNYVYEAGHPSYRHARPVTWLALGVPRAAFSPEFVPSLSAELTIYQIKRHDGEAEVQTLLEWQKAAPLAITP